MKIVITDTTMHGPLIGGAQTFLPGLMRGLCQNGHEVHLVSKSGPDIRVKESIEKSGAVLHTGIWKKNRLVEDTAPVFAKWINDHQPDVYLISVSPDIGWAVLPLLHPSIATLTVGHTDDETFYLPARHYHPFLTRAIGVSLEITSHYASSCHISPEKIDRIPYGVTVNPEAPVDHQDGILKMVYVGRVVEEQKRISDLLLIVKALGKENIQFKLTIVGDGDAMPVVRHTLEREIAEGKVELTGWLKNSEIINVLRHSDVFVLTSAYEGFCISLVEAIANGCCPVVTDIRSGNKELVKDSVNGFVVGVGDIEKFTQRLKELAENPAKLQELRTAAWKEGKQYSTMQMVLNYEQSFHRSMQDVQSFTRAPDPYFPLMETCRSKYPVWARRLKMLVTRGN